MRLLLLVGSLVSTVATLALSGVPAGPDTGSGAALVAGDVRTAVIVQFTTPPAGRNTRSAAAAFDLERSRLANDLTGKAQGTTLFRHDYRRVFNGVALLMSKSEVKRVRALSYVKAVFDDAPVRATLMDSVPLIGANQVWSQLGITGLGVRVAVIDTGVDYTQPDLGSCFGAACKVVGGYDFVNGDGDPMDDHGHGTHVAGIVAANGVVKGVAPGAKILAYKVLDSAGDGYSSVIMAALDVALDPDGNPGTDDGAQVANLSLGGYGDPDDPLSQSVDAAVDAGMVVCAAAGNSGPFAQTIGSPGTARKAITVGATDKLDVLADFSSRGPVVWPGGALLKPDLVAPGVAICSTRWDGSWAGLECVDQAHVAVSGTSMATPHVAGAAALLVAAHPTWTPTEIKTALRNTALDLGYDWILQGHGRLRVLQAAQLPHAPPIASIQTSGVLSGPASILGTATSATFQRYSLYFGEGTNPTSWTLLRLSTTPVANGVLYAGFNPCRLPDGTHSLRLDVFDTDGHVSQDRAVVLIDNVSFSAPLNDDIVRRGDSIELHGSILCGPGSFVVQYGVGDDPTQWLTSGITLANDGSAPIVNGPLATWNTSAVGATGYMTLRAVSTSSFGQRQEMLRHLYLDPTLKAGWPRRLPWQFESQATALRTTARYYSFPRRRSEGAVAPSSPSAPSTPMVTVSTDSAEFATLAGFYYWAGYIEPVVADLDGDGHKEVIVYQGGSPPKVVVFRDDGTPRWTAPVGNTDVSGGNLHIPVIADIDGDGLPEVIVYRPVFSPEFAELYAFASDGTSKPGWPITLPIDYHPSLLAADLDRDGHQEIVVKGNGANERKLVIVAGDGSIRAQWDLTLKRWGASLESAPAVGDLDGDGQLEIVTADPSESAGYDPSTGQWNNTGIVNVFRMNGSQLPGWPRLTSGIIFSSPAVGDINHDGHDEIVVGLQYASSDVDTNLGGLYAFDGAGNVLPGWPVLRGSSFWSCPALGDLDGNGDLEIAASHLNLSTYVFHHDGSVAAGWPRSTSWADFYSTVMGDVDGDGFPDVLTTAGSVSYGGGVYAWRFNGAPISGFPRPTEVDAQAPVTIADIDLDGQVELIASSDWDRDLILNQDKLRSSIYVWTLPAPYAKATMHWPQVRHDARLTALYRLPQGTSGPAGRVPDPGFVPGTPLKIARAPGGDIKLTWGASCASNDDDFEIYEGLLGAFTSHVPRACSTGGAGMRTLTPAAGNRYYVVVSRNPSREGSYGQRSGGSERPASASACLPRQIVATCP